MLVVSRLDFDDDEQRRPVIDDEGKVRFCPSLKPLAPGPETGRCERLARHVALQNLAEPERQAMLHRRVAQEREDHRSVGVLVAGRVPAGVVLHVTAGETVSDEAWLRASAKSSPSRARSSAVACAHERNPSNAPWLQASTRSSAQAST